MQPAVLTPIPVDPIDDALLVPGALVVHDGALRPPEEALASLAGYHTVVDAGRLVAAHFAGDDLDLRCGWERRKKRKQGLV